MFCFYTATVWHVASKYTKADWQAEKLQLVQKALETTQHRQKLAQEIGKQIDEKLSNMQTVQKTINQKVIREVIKEPVYSNCVTTPDGVRLIEDAIRNRGQSPSQ